MVMIGWMKKAWEYLRDGYAVVIASIERWPHYVFWLVLAYLLIRQ